MIAAGSSYEQILSACPHLTYLDIFNAACEALDLSVAHYEGSKPAHSVAEIRGTQLFLPSKVNPATMFGVPNACQETLCAEYQPCSQSQL
jgi:hypothetical protein